MPKIETLNEHHSDELARFWREAFPHTALDHVLLRQRVFGPPSSAPENSFCYFDDRGRMMAISLLVPPCPPDADGSAIGGIRWFGVHPTCRGLGLGKDLLKASCERLAFLGATAVDMIATPPYYIAPGIDIRETRFISWLLRRGFEHTRTNFNMSLDLERVTLPQADEVFSADTGGHYLRRARPEDREPFTDFCRREWGENWAIEASLGLDHDPVSLFLAFKLNALMRRREEEEIVGFAVYEANQGLGSFGPTGVSPRHRGHGLGKRLLQATLLDMKSLGRRRCEIGWVGPVDFYHRAVGATLGPVYWAMRRKLDRVAG